MISNAELKKLRERLNRQPFENKTLKEFASTFIKVTDLIVRGGKTPSGGNQPTLRPKTIKKRIELSKKVTTDPSYKPSRSNLTFSGQLLSSVTFRQIADRKFLIFSQGKHDVYGKNLPNEEIFKRLQKRGFIYFEGSQRAIKQCTKVLKDAIKRGLRF